MEQINRTNSYTMYKGEKNNEKYIVAISNTINNEIEIKVKFNDNLPVMEVNKCYISITNKNIQLENIRDITVQTYKDLITLGYTRFASQIKIIVDTEEEYFLASKVDQSKIFPRLQIEKSPKYQVQEQIKDTQEKLKNFMTTKTITKEDNGIMKKFIIRKKDNKNTGYLLDASLISESELYNALIDLKRQGLEEESMSKEELANLVIDKISIAKNLKRLPLEEPSKQSNLANIGLVTGTVATATEGVGNKEAGIVIPGSNGTNVEGYAVEENNNKINVVEAQVTTTRSTTEGSSMTTDTPSAPYSFNHQSNASYNNSNFPKQDVPQTGVYYKQENEETQSRNNIESRNKVRKKVLTPDNQRGIISLPVIIFIISGLLLIASAVIFFMTK